MAPVPAEPQTNEETNLARVTETHVGPVFRVERHELTDASGRPIIRDVVRHPGAVTVIAFDPDGALVLVRNRRIAVGCSLLEFCAGKLEPGEEPVVAAARELEEETGRRAGRIEALGSFFTSPGFADERMHVFVAHDLTEVPMRLEPGEEIEVVRLDEIAFESAIASGAIIDGKTLASWQLLRARSRALQNEDQSQHRDRGAE